jgi:hypothetical protein
MFNYSRLVTPYINDNNADFEPVPRGHVRIGATLNASRTMRDKRNQSKIAGRTVTRVCYFYIAPNVEISQWANKEGHFSFGDGYIDVPAWQAKKLGILGDYFSVITRDGTFSKKEQNEMSKPHGASCRCFGDRCIIPF